MEIGYIEEVIPSLRCALLLHDYGRLDEVIAAGCTELQDDFLELWYEAIGHTMDCIYSDYLDAYELNIWYFSDSAMMDYYRLCRVYSRGHRMKLKDNPYMAMAEDAVESSMEFGTTYGYGWRLQTGVGHKWASGIVFRSDCQFYGEYLLLCALFEIQDWYQRACYRLRSVLLEERLLWLPALPAHQEESV